MNRRELLRIKRHRRLKLRMRGEKYRPRLIVHRSHKHLSAQIIDDTQDKTLFSMTTQDKEIRDKFKNSGHIKASEFFGEVFSRLAKEKGFSKVIFDRAGYLYHGRVKAFADALRKGGLEF